VVSLLPAVLGVLLSALSARGQFPPFTDVASAAGLTLVNVSGEGDNDYILEANGSGGAFFDYDGDGDMDAIIANGSTLELMDAGGSPVVALYENRGGSFVDVTAAAGFDDRGWAFGLCVADVDNDGDSDFYVTAYGPNLLYINNGDGTFEERGAAAGADHPGWGTNCAFGDYDRDGDVDLYVANYVDFDRETIPRRGSDECIYMGALPVYCGPKDLAGDPDVLFRNDGEGTFTDVTGEAGVAMPPQYGFGVVFSDLDNDGWPDIYVANDSVPNFLFHNKQDGTFEEIGLISGASVNLAGFAQAGMGIAAGDYDNDGLVDLYVTHFSEDTNTLYRNLGGMFFADVTAASGAAIGSRPHIGWGTGLVDLDNDGWLDLFVVNGHVYPRVDDLAEGSKYLQRKEIYRNLGNGRFEEVTAELGGDLLDVHASRGAAFGDFDDDGDIDVLVTNMNSLPSLYRNEYAGPNTWIGFKLEGTTSNRAAIGARVEIETGGRTMVREVRSGASFLSHNDLRLHFGLGEAETVDTVRVRWPNGDVETFEGRAAGSYVIIREGEGIGLH
jgi:predicted nucleotidyltransferase